MVQGRVVGVGVSIKTEGLTHPDPALPLLHLLYLLLLRLIRALIVLFVLHNHAAIVVDQDLLTTHHLVIDCRPGEVCGHDRLLLLVRRAIRVGFWGHLVASHGVVLLGHHLRIHWEVLNKPRHLRALSFVLVA